MKLSQGVIKSLVPGKVFNSDNSKSINSLDFSDDGELLITASDDESIHLYHVGKAEMQKEIFSKKYGVDLIKFTHHSTSVICASKNKDDHTIRYLSLYDNHYLRYFKGHRHRVVSLAMSPHDDSFASASLDESVRFWDLGTNACKGLLRVNGRSCVAYDPAHEHVLAVATPYNLVKLYDDRYFDKGPFANYVIDAIPLEFVDVQFSPKGSYILLSTAKSIVILDAMKGTKLKEFTDYDNEGDSKASFTPDEQFVLCGADDGSIHFWDVQSGQKIHVLKEHSVSVANVLWNPKYMTFASACTNLCLWIPQQFTI